MKYKKSIFFGAVVSVFILSTMPVYANVLNDDYSKTKEQFLESNDDSCKICGDKGIDLHCIRLYILYILSFKSYNIYKTARDVYKCKWALRMDPPPVNIDIQAVRFLFNHKLN